MNPVAIFLDLGNVFFFLSNVPQLVTAYRNRQNLAGISKLMLYGFMASTMFFIFAGILAEAYITVLLGFANLIFFGCQLAWKEWYG